MPFTW